MAELDANRYITIFKEGSFYNIVNNDALIFNKHFGYKLFSKNNEIRAGFPIVSLNKNLHRLDGLSMNYRVLNGLEIIAEKTFENNLYEILEEPSFSNEPSTSTQTKQSHFHYDKPDYRAFVNALSGLCNNTDFYTGEVINGISQDTKNQIQTLLSLLEKRAEKHEQKYGVSTDIDNRKQETIIKNEIHENLQNTNIAEETLPVTDNNQTNYINNHNENLEKVEPKKDFQPTCKNCMLYKREDCFGKDTICEDYKYAPDMDDEKRKNWPKYGDATFFRMHRHGRK